MGDIANWLNESALLDDYDDACDSLYYIPSAAVCMYCHKKFEWRWLPGKGWRLFVPHTSRQHYCKDNSILEDYIKWK